MLYRVNHQMKQESPKKSATLVSFMAMEPEPNTSKAASFALSKAAVTKAVPKHLKGSELGFDTMSHGGATATT